MGGDRFRSVARAFWGFIRRTLWQQGIRSCDLDDVCQEVLRAIDRGLPAFDPALAHDPADAERLWIFGICQRQAASWARDGAKRGEVHLSNEELDMWPADAVGAEQGMLSAERSALFLRAFATLKPERQAVIVAYDLECVPMVDVAAALRIPVNTAWNRRRLALADLRAFYRRRRVGSAGD